MSLLWVDKMYVLVKNQLLVGVWSYNYVPNNLEFTLINFITKGAFTN